MNADGSSQINLTDHLTGNDWSPAWSPDGSKIVFQSDRGNNFNYDIYVMNVNGTNLINLTNRPTQNDSAPAW